MDFPRVVFIVPGTLPRHGGTFGQELVQDEEELKIALKAGFFATLPEAIEASKNPKPKEIVVPEGPKNPDEMSGKELKAELDALKVEIPKGSKVADLAELLKKARG